MMDAGSTAITDEPTKDSPAVPATQPPPLRSVHTTTIVQILQQFGVSLAVTTYQAGKLVLLRSEARDGGYVLNTHFRDFQKPMGFAWERGRFALGTNGEIWEFHNLPALAGKLEKSTSGTMCDAVFLPRSCHFTGDIQIHEMLWLPRQQAADRGSDNLSELCSSIPDSPAWQHAAINSVSFRAGSRRLSLR